MLKKYSLFFLTLHCLYAHTGQCHASPPLILPQNISYNQFVPFNEILSGAKAFYNQATYTETTSADFQSHQTLPINYTWNTEKKTTRIAKKILTIILFPIGVYQFLHSCAGTVFLTSSISYSKKYCKDLRSGDFLTQNTDWEYKRITIVVDGYKIDAMLMGKKATLGNGRWILASHGRQECYERKLSYSKTFKSILSETQSNVIAFNYPGVGASSGLPNRKAMIKTYCALLHFLEDKDYGIGASEIIGYGYSIGGGVQGEALKMHELKKEIKYVFVKHSTFSNLSTTVSSLTNKYLGFFTKVLGWNIDSVESSKQLKAPEIIIQKAEVPICTVIKEDRLLADDGVITAHASLAKALLKIDKRLLKNKKVFIGVTGHHNSPLENPIFLSHHIQKLLIRED